MPKGTKKVEEVDEDDFDALLENDEDEQVEEEDVEEIDEDEMEAIDEEEIDAEEYQKELQALQRLRKGQQKPVTYKAEEMSEIAEEMKIKMPGGKDLTWEESLSITTKTPVRVLNPQDDLEREKKLYESTFAAVAEGIELLDKHNIAFRRPTDFFAEMLKSDEQMKKVKGALLKQKEDIEASEERRRKRDQKKFGKKIEAAKRVEKEKKKNETEKKLESWAKKRNHANDDDFGIELDTEEEPQKKRKLNPAQKGKVGERTPNPKRQAKNEKFKTPGKRRGDKRNTSESSSDLSKFSVKKNKTIDPEMRKHLPKKKQSPAKRPGKNRRQQKPRK